ncbi:hypothetical protein COCSUDRAFT_83639 [Coccomyxa subellipsoidea C-169]|uniref:Dolichyl-diphosphooligosaccharide--protein glycosyltransferase subunit DAD1 n=1 Tax=Coccomyxa subellipsoidea (strain C-169) TaxID=574566 RepID=I0Z4R3_COCSC|nr:hypothetical protein COCSUDRAFT_83639 [Coccomyxa subellipsoidea C-169]EIE25632.1 hypothetical protein COCSUDRAFT_83639 [Coccomyxa subellipsoidea C-169]|eukprot:XP_005650176.1 hypothetical protein COCSUDRAFT_83639 [Coccomyxa subellipsoidea C-169]
MQDFRANANVIIKSFNAEYRKTPLRIKVIDAFMVYALLTAAVQFVYMLCVGTFPFNSFLSGFFCSIGFFVLTVSLRMQVDPSSDEFKGLLPERAYADFVLCGCLLFLVVWNFMG